MKRFRRSAIMVEMALSPPSLRSKRRRTTEVPMKPSNTEEDAKNITNDENPDDAGDEFLSTPPDAQPITEPEAKPSDVKKSPEKDEETAKSEEKLISLENDSVKNSKEELKVEEKPAVTKHQPLAPLNPPSPRKSISSGMKAPVGRPRLSSRGLRMLAMAKTKEGPQEEEVASKPADTSQENLSEDEHPAPLESLPKFDSQKPWVRYSYSPSASPRTGILKVSPSPGNSGQRVRFSTEIEKVEIPAEGKLRSLRTVQNNKARRGLMYGGGSNAGKAPMDSLLSVGEEPADQIGIDDIVAGDDEGFVSQTGSEAGEAKEEEVGKFEEEKVEVEESDEGKAELEEIEEKPKEDDVEEMEEDGEKEVEQETETESVEAWEPFYPALLGCTEPVGSLVAELTPANWVPMLREALAEHKVETIGDFARLSVAMINNLPIIAPAGKTPVEIAKKKLGLFEDTPSSQDKQKSPVVMLGKKPLGLEKVENGQQNDAETMTEKPNVEQIRTWVKNDLTLQEKLDLFLDLLQDKQFISSPRVLDFVLNERKNEMDTPTLLNLARDKTDVFNHLARDEQVVQQASNEAVGSILNSLEPQKIVAALSAVTKNAVLDSVAEKEVAVLGRKFNQALNKKDDAAKECSFSDCVSICESLLSSRPAAKKELLSRTRPAVLADAIKTHRLPEFTNALMKKLKVKSWSQLRLEMEQKVSWTSSGCQTDEVEPGKEEFVAVLENLASGPVPELVSHAKDIAGRFMGDRERCRNLLNAVGYHLWANEEA